MYKFNSGITLMALAITIIVLIILTSVTVYMGMDNAKDSINANLISELEIIRNAVLKQYYNYTVTKKQSDIIGEQVSAEDITSIENELNIDMNNESDLPYEKRYYRLTPIHLEQIGIRQSKNTYIVNYSTGEILNETVKKISDDELLYISGISVEN